MCRYNNESQTSEMFNTAGRTVKSGLVASAVVSSWTWAATLLQSSGVAYRYGVSGPFWVSHAAQGLLCHAHGEESLTLAPSMHLVLPFRSSSLPRSPLSSRGEHPMLIPFLRSSGRDMVSLYPSTRSRWNHAQQNSC